MKYTFVTLLSILSFITQAQCTNCTSFEEALKNPEKVKTLKINPWQHDVTLDSVPASIGTFVNAEIIYLSGHNFSTIPSSIGNLKNLKELSFAECKLTSLPEEIFQLNNLRELILWNNEFSEEYVEKAKARFAKEMPKTKLRIGTYE